MISPPTPTPRLDSGKRTGLEELGHSSLAVAVVIDKHTQEEWPSRKNLGRGPAGNSKFEETRGV